MSAVADAVMILAPLVEEVADCITHDRDTPALARLPETLRSEVELARAKERARKAGKA